MISCYSTRIGPSAEFQGVGDNRTNQIAENVAGFANELFAGNAPHPQLPQMRGVTPPSPGTVYTLPSKYPHLSSLVLVNSESQIEHFLFDTDEDGKFYLWAEVNHALRRIGTGYENIRHFVRSRIPRYLPDSQNKTEHLLAQCEWNITFREVEETLQNAVIGTACLTPGENEGCYLLHILDSGSVINRKELFIQDEKIFAIDGELQEADSLPELLLYKLGVQNLFFVRNENNAPERFKAIEYYYQSAFPYMIASGEKWFKLSRGKLGLSCSFYISKDWEFYLHNHKEFFPNGAFVGKGKCKCLWEALPVDPQGKQLVRARIQPEIFSSPRKLMRFIENLKTLLRELSSDLKDFDEVPLLIPEIFSHQRRKDNTTVYDQMMPKLMGDLIDERNNLNLKGKLQVALQVAQALSFMHSKGIVHRDVKPDNVLIESLDPAKSWLGDLDFIEKYTGNEPLSLKGTLIYTDPNVIRIRAYGLEDAIAADQFSWALLLYILLFDRHVYRGENPLESAPAVPEEYLTNSADDFYSIHPKLQKILLTLLLRVEPADGSMRLIMHEERPTRMDAIIEDLKQVIEEIS